MTTLDDLDRGIEDRLRSGLRSAAEALPATAEDLTPAAGAPGGRPLPLYPATPLWHRRWVRTSLAAAATLAAVVGTAVVLTRDPSADDRASTDLATESSAPTSSTTTAAPHEAQLLNGMVPGQATADGDGTAVHVYGPDGRETGHVELAMDNVQAAASDLQGGWVVCGSVNTPASELPGGEGAVLGPWAGDPGAAGTAAEAAAQERAGARAEVPTTAGGPTTLPPGTGASNDLVGVPTMNWYPAHGDPVNLGGDWGPSCYENGLQVVDSPDGPMALLGGLGSGPRAGQVRLEGVVLATGEHRDLPVPALAGLPDQWSATTGKVLTYVDGVGLQLWKLGDATPLPMASIDPGAISDMALSHDGKTVAVMVGSIDGPDDVVVYDLASGAEIFRRSFDMSVEGDSMSYDGTTLAVGNYYPDYGPITVIDMATHAEHTIDASGVVL